ncbi:MAG: hypothetical protein MJ180_00020 [Candidatus Gastranaerophilales bacterium]|nr:hypothetical protein [Candidatus Gastranaerophilales bacterium]
MEKFLRGKTKGELVNLILDFTTKDKSFTNKIICYYKSTLKDLKEELKKAL